MGWPNQSQRRFNRLTTARRGRPSPQRRAINNEGATAMLRKLDAGAKSSVQTKLRRLPDERAAHVP
jgi:hypothetical protein